MMKYIKRYDELLLESNINIETILKYEDENRYK
jgi:hypothetical protein